MRCCTTLVIEGRLGTTSAIAKQLWSKISKLLFGITVRRVLREGAQVQQRKPFMICEHVLARLRFAQKYENWTIDDRKRTIFNDETKINRCNSNGRLWCWIGDGAYIRPQYVHQTMKHGGGSVMIRGCNTVFGLGAWYMTESRMDRHFYKFIFEEYCGPLYIITIWIQLGWFFNRIMIPSTQARSCKNAWHHNHFNSFNGLHNLRIWIPWNTLGHFSNGAWTNLQHLQEVSKKFESVCVQCIPNLVNKTAWRFMKACHKELMLCWSIGVTRPITKDFVGNLNKIEYMYIVSHLALHHTFLLSM